MLLGAVRFEGRGDAGLPLDAPRWLPLEPAGAGEVELLAVRRNVHRYPMPLTSLECQVSKLVNSDSGHAPYQFGVSSV